MKERPILFSDEMVRAILDDRKTMTRRVVKPQPNETFREMCATIEPEGWQTAGRSFRWTEASDTGARVWHCPFGVPGDRLWVREAWQALHFSTDWETGIVDDWWPAEEIPSGRDGYWDVVYRASDEQASYHPDDRGFGWRPSVHMPRWASRITLELMDVRVERVREISEEDAKAEGIERVRGEFAESTYRHAFSHFWSSLHAGKPGCSWADNPWCWCLSFRRLP